VDAEFTAGSEMAVSTTMVFTRILRNLIRDKQVGPRIVPIIPDEARTFGMDPLFKEVGIYAALGQHYVPVDSELLLSYREAVDGQVLEEGITEAGSMASFQAAATSYATHGHPMIPFYIYYSMFGFQRTGDQIWALADARGRGFMMGATAGRTTLAGEGLQHADGHSHILASTVPNVRAYDPAYAYELAAIVREGIERMYVHGEDVFYYVSLYNENYPQPPKPDGIDEGLIRGIYRFRDAPDVGRKAQRARLVGSGPTLNLVLSAQELLAEKFGIAAEVYSAPSFPLLRRDALESERWNRLHPAEAPRVPYVSTILGPDGGPIVAATDWLKALPDMSRAGSRPATSRSGPTGSAGAIPARRSAPYSRSIRRTSPPRRLRSWRAAGPCRRIGRRRRSASSMSIRRSSIRFFYSGSVLLPSGRGYALSQFEVSDHRQDRLPLPRRPTLSNVGVSSPSKGGGTLPFNVCADREERSACLTTTPSAPGRAWDRGFPTTIGWPSSPIASTLSERR
jgi:transketolase C-terminal domain/subunit